MRMAAVVLSATLASLAMVGNSRAGTVTETYNFTLNDFVDIIGSSPSPITSISGSFTLTFDPSVSYVDNTTNITGSITGIPNAPVVASTMGSIRSLVLHTGSRSVGSTGCRLDLLQYE